MDDSRAPELAEVIRDAVENGILEVHTSLPCKVAKYNADTQTVDCKPVVQRAYLDEEDQRRVESLPVIPHVPVCFMGGGGYRVTFPLAVGDLGAIIFFECSADRWLMGDGAEVDPGIDHHHALMDGFFVPGACRPKKAALSSAPTDEMTMGKDDGVQIHCEAGVITIGDKSGSDYVALAQKVKDELDKISQVIASHKHLLVMPGVGSSGVSDTPYTASVVSASQLKAK